MIVDVTPETWCIDPDLVEAAITPRTRAIIPVHLGHQMADMDRLTEIADRHGLAVIEDCAHAHGQQWRGRGAGCIGDFGSFSHQSSKILTSGEGGTLLANDDTLARRAHSIIDCGRAKDTEEKEFTFGANYRLSELNAALLVVAMRRFPDSRKSAQPTAFASSGWRPTSQACGSCPRRRITRWSFYNYILAIDPVRSGAPRTRPSAPPSRRGHPGGGAVPADEPLRAVPAVAVTPVAVEHAESPRSPGMSFPVAEAAGSANPSTSWRRCSATAPGVQTRSTPSRRCSGTRGSCRGTDRERQAGKNLGRWRSFAASSASSRGRARS